MKVLENCFMGGQSTLLPTHNMDGLTAIAGCDLNATESQISKAIIEASTCRLISTMMRAEASN